MIGMIITGHVVLNYGLNVMLWQQRKLTYVAMCFLQTVATISAVYLSIVLLHKDITYIIYSIAGVTTFCGVLSIILISKQLSFRLSQLRLNIFKKLLLFGLPFALNAFFKQLLYSIDRYFLIKNNIIIELPQYILAAKIASFINVMASSTFILAFTPYSLNKLNDENAESEISELFRFIAIIAFAAIPFILFFKGIIIEFFADSSYTMAYWLLPIFLYAWVFDLFTYFTLLGIYKSQKSILIIGTLLVGTTVIAVLNTILVPKLGVLGAALSFLFTKAGIFLITQIYLRQYFHLKISISFFLFLLIVSVLCTYSSYFFPWFVNLIILFILLSAILYYMYKTYAGINVLSYFKKSNK